MHQAVSAFAAAGGGSASAASNTSNTKAKNVANKTPGTGASSSGEAQQTGKGPQSRGTVPSVAEALLLDAQARLREVENAAAAARRARRDAATLRKATPVVGPGVRGKAVPKLQLQPSETVAVSQPLPLPLPLLPLPPGEEHDEDQV